MKDRKQPETLRLKSVMPALTVDDLDASIAWYRDVLDFLVVQEHEREGKRVAVALQAGTVLFMLGQDDFAKGRDRVKGQGLRLYAVSGQDIDQLAIDIKARGGALDQEPKDQPWGARDFAVVDPDGFKISISSATGEE